ncbi:DUF4019 domain-containing protein [Sphingosinicella sp. BN140058]|uniref:DUF4019 domain-containing protein n=1 Tax=Sphingosinicella sp. BN140058 TaxID=1892855 RepID=UPI0010101F72|nr:DUF4019 domain-containing protein [Sphingosinicella sp. BN140058]QAY75768.1 DUF4019 domain-containing protein [Sphingosinicella sp. BN140058]
MVRAFLVMVASVAVAGCSTGERVAAAQSQVARFHSLLNAERYGEIYDQSSSELKAAGSKEKFVTFLTAVHRKLGAAGEASQQGFNVNFTPGVSHVALSYKTRFARGEAAETFVFSSNGGATKLVSYNINSEALIVG